MATDALIVCGTDDEARYEHWLRILFQAGAQKVFVFTDSSFGFMVDGGGRVYCGWDGVVEHVAVVLVHQGDSSVWRSQVAAHAVFWFDAPGRPAGQEGDFRIRRQTDASSFEVTVDDAKEILAYGRGERKELPSCCLPRRADSCIPAIAILCQGYLAVFGKNAKEAVEPEVQKALDRMGWNSTRHAALVKVDFPSVAACCWWLQGLGVEPDEATSSPSKTGLMSMGAFRVATAAEWGKDPMPTEVIALLDKLGKAEPIELPLLVARAYSAVAEHLSIRR